MNSIKDIHAFIRLLSTISALFQILFSLYFLAGLLTDSLLPDKASPLIELNGSWDLGVALVVVNSIHVTEGDMGVCAGA